MKKIPLIFIFTLLFSVSSFVYADIILENSTAAYKNIIKVPLVRQSTEYSCGAATLQSILQYYGSPQREDMLIKMLETNPENGTSYKKIVSFSKSLGFEVTTKENLSLEELKKYMDSKNPVLTLIQAWKTGSAPYSTDWDDGHYVVVIGYDDKNFYFMDPSTLGYYTFIPAAEFLDRWHDVDEADTGKLNHFGIIISGKKPIYNPEIIIKLE